MENFVLYDEVGRGDHSVVYKGRRKGTINFVSIHCIDKIRRPQITNLVRLTCEINHRNVVKFHEWYETSNNLWLVVELCTGGSLETVISQDDHLPESSIRKFGVDLVQGLHHLHSLGIIFSDMKPSKILLDGPGVLKFASFGLSRVEGENLDELFAQFAETGETYSGNGKGEEQDSDTPKKFKTLGSPTYMAPEVMDGAELMMIADLWALGCVLYEMYTGHPPFLAENFNDLMDKILHKDVPPLKVKGSRVSGKASPEFQSLVYSLLKKDPNERLDWHGLVTHAFWQGQLQHLAKELEANSEAQRQSVRESFRRSIASTIRASYTSDLPKGNSVLGNIHGVEIQNDLRKSHEGLEELVTMERPVGTLPLETVPEASYDGASNKESTLSDFRPRTAPGGGDSNVNFTISSRATTPAPDEHTSPQRPLTLSTADIKNSLRKGQRSYDDLDDVSDASQLIFHSTDFSVSTIVDNPKIQKPAAMKYDPKTLPVPPYTVEKLMKLPVKDQDKHIGALCDALSAPEKGPPSQKRIHLLNYTGTVASNNSVANRITKRGVLAALAKQTKDASQFELKSRLARVLGIIANNTTEVDESVNLSEVVTTLTEVIRDSFRNGKTKAAVLPAFGEAMFLVAAQEEIKGRSIDNWSVPTMAYTFLIRCLREGEDPVVNHYAAKIVENIATTSTGQVQKLAGNEVGQLLWYVFTHATADSLRITALSALSRLSKHSVSVFQSVIEKVGLPKMLSTMALPISRIQQAVITMFGCLVTSDARLTRLIQDKDFVLHVMRLLESTSAVIRGKAFLVLLEVIKCNHEMFLVACQNRLVMYVERDSRKQTLSNRDTLQHSDYLTKCLEVFVTSLVDMIPSITKSILAALDAVSGRKHPSTVQVKQLKAVLPLSSVLQNLVSSQVFRPHLVTEKFMKDLGLLLVHVKSIDAGATQIKGATGPNGAEEFIHTVFSIVESIAQHPSILLEFHSLVIDKILRSLAQLVSGSGGDTRGLSLRLFSEIASLFLNQAQFDAAQHKSDAQKLELIMAEALLPQYEQILLEQDPLPSYGLKLLLALLEQSPAFIKEFEKLGLTAVLFQVLLDHQNNPTGHTMQQVAAILNCLVAHKETNVKELYDQGLVEHVMSLMVEVSAVCLTPDAGAQDLKGPCTMLQSLLDTLHYALKYVSEVVRKALQAKKGGSEQGTKEAEQAEQLLLRNKPFTDLMSLLTQLLIYEDADITEIALKCLSLLVQLFGGEHADGMSQENMECYSEALKKADPKKQKVILRIIKRMISTEKSHAESMKQNGPVLVQTINSLAQTASSHAEVALSTLAADILKIVGKS